MQSNNLTDKQKEVLKEHYFTFEEMKDAFKAGQLQEKFPHLTWEGYLKATFFDNTQDTEIS